MARFTDDPTASIGAYVFDAYGTLFDVHSAVRRHAAALGPDCDRVSGLWRSKQLEYSWVRSLAGRYRDFWSLTEDALDFALAVAAPAALHMKGVLLETYRALDAYPEVRSTLITLKNGGARLAILSNGTPAMLASAVDSASLAGLIDEVVSVDAVGIYKTDPRAYALAETTLGVSSSAISFQSSNRWDIVGAAAHGFRTVWVNRSGQPDEYKDIPPTRVVSSLQELLG